jgi:S1/P1 Nuclease
MRSINFFLLTVIFIFSTKKAMAWGPEGHAIVGRLAMHFVKDDVRKNVLELLGKMTIDTAANWMDIMKSNADYDFMRIWHYLDFPKDKVYTVTNNDNIVNRLILTYNELCHKKTLCTDQIRTDLFVLLHLMGDITMPLHTGYDDDLGGNKVMVQYDTLKTHNLHRFWDEDIIAIKKITDKDCLDMYKNNFIADTIKGIDFVKYMQESRSLLPAVYDYEGFMLDDKYLNKNKTVVVRQLLLSGLRLAEILNKLFYTSAPAINFDIETAKYKNGVKAANAINNIGKYATVCEKVFSVRTSQAITQINIGSKYPNSPLTIVIFAKNYANFKVPPDELYKDKNICVRGIIKVRQGKAQIVIEKPADIIVIE